MDYMGTLTKTFNQWWKHKYLWIIGMIGTLLGGGGANFNSFSSAGNSSSLSSRSNQYMENVLKTIRDPQYLTIIIVAIIIIVVLGLIIYALALYLHARAESSIFQSTKLIAEKDEKLGFSKAWSLGKYKLKTLVQQQLLMVGPILFVGILLGIVALLMMRTTSSSVIGPNPMTLLLMCFGMIVLSLTCIAVIYVIGISFGLFFGKRIVVFENKSAIQGIKLGFKFFTNNFSELLMFWLVSLLYGIAAGIITFMTVLIMLGGGVAVVIALIFINPIIAIVVGIVLLLIFSVLLTLISGPIYAFEEMYWTNVYLDIKKFKKLV